jgi:hypothetical protein
MNPLEDIVVALTAMRQTTLPAGWLLPNSIRPLDVTEPVGFTSTMAFTNVDPQNHPVTVVNDLTNFGWEYVWHCHILGHEENDMMRPMVMVVAPQAPTNLVSLGGGTISWTDNSLNETGFTIQTAASATATTWTTVATVPAAPGNGTTVTYKNGKLIKSGSYYRVVANNLAGYTRAFTAPAVGYPTMSMDSLPSNVLLY